MILDMKSWQEEPENYDQFTKWCKTKGIKVGSKINQLIRKHLIDQEMKVKNYD